jgi:polyhydroxyalkanoate synthesis regulator protein
MTDDQSGSVPVLIKRYAGRLFYNTTSSSYVTLDDILAMLGDDQHVLIRDAETGWDITSAIIARLWSTLH